MRNGSVNASPVRFPVRYLLIKNSEHRREQRSERRFHESRDIILIKYRVTGSVATREPRLARAAFRYAGRRREIGESCARVPLLVKQTLMLLLSQTKSNKWTLSWPAVEDARIAWRTILQLQCHPRHPTLVFAPSTAPSTPSVARTMRNIACWVSNSFVSNSPRFDGDRSGLANFRFFYLYVSQVS